MPNIQSVSKVRPLKYDNKIWNKNRLISFSFVFIVKMDLGIEYSKHISMFTFLQCI